MKYQLLDRINIQLYSKEYVVHQFISLVSQLFKGVLQKWVWMLPVASTKWSQKSEKMCLAWKELMH